MHQIAEHRLDSGRLSVPRRYWYAKLRLKPCGGFDGIELERCKRLVQVGLDPIHLGALWCDECVHYAFRSHNDMPRLRLDFSKRRAIMPKPRDIPDKMHSGAAANSRTAGLECTL